MPRKATGNVYESRGRWYARVKLGPKARPSIALPTCATEAAAVALLPLLADLAAKLRAAPNVSLEVAVGLLERAATREGKAREAVIEAVGALCRGEAKIRGTAIAPGALSPAMSFRSFGELWTSGELARRFPDHVKVKRSAGDDVYRLELHIYPIVGLTPIGGFSLDDAQAVMRALPSRSSWTRRHVAQLMHRLLAIAVFPARLIASSPLPRGFLPRAGSATAKTYLYPNEDARLLACPAVPLAPRVLYGFLDREGPRVSEAVRLTWGDFDLERGAVNLDENKTDDPRTWALSPGVTRALRAWRTLRGNPPAAALVFSDDAGKALRVDGGAERFRAYLHAAGVDRPDLFERSKARQPIRVHDLRATFITINLATGRSETWIADRTGHKSSVQINTYRRAARTFAELGQGELADLDTAIPELGSGAERKGGGKGGAGEPASAKPLQPKRKARSAATASGSGSWR